MSGPHASVIKLSKGRMYELIRAPIVTEKSTVITEYNQVTFRVPLDASKPEIRAAVEGLFNAQTIPGPSGAPLGR